MVVSVSVEYVSILSETTVDRIFREQSEGTGFSSYISPCGMTSLHDSHLFCKTGLKD